jgi:diguanylate cyclase (GGDEF)-like protein
MLPRGPLIVAGWANGLAGIAFPGLMGALEFVARGFGFLERVSLFFPVPGLCFAYGYLLRPWALPLAAVVLTVWELSEGRSLPIHGWRQLAIYGGMGILARQLLTPARLRRRMRQLGTLALLSVGAVLLSLPAALAMWRWEGWLAWSMLPEVVPSFLVGDLAGLLPIACAVVLLAAPARGVRLPPPRELVLVGAAAIVTGGLAFAMMRLGRRPLEASVLLAGAAVPMLLASSTLGYGVTLLLNAVFLVGVTLTAAFGSQALPIELVAVAALLLVVATLIAGAATSDRRQRIDRLEEGYSRAATKLRLRNLELARANRELERAATFDHLTGLLRRQAFEDAATRLLEHARHAGRPCALLLIDIDHFKRINDEEGHLTGDMVLRTLGERLRHTVRASDPVGRWGGEELVVMLTPIDASILGPAAERLRRALQDEPVALPDGRLLRVTASVGVALATPADRLEDLLERADRGLYRAKARGRDRCEIEPSDGPA